METNCDICVFFQNNECEFDIHNLINNQIIKDSEHTRILDYQCKYAFSKNIAEKNYDKFSYEEMKEKIFNINSIKYTLAIHLDDINQNLDEIITTINNIKYKPQDVLLITQNKPDTRFIESNLKYRWKISHIIVPLAHDQQMSCAIDSFLSIKKNSKYILYYNKDISNIDEDIHNIHIKLNIQNIDGLYIKNINSLDGLFISYDQYTSMGTSKHILFIDPEEFIRINESIKVINYND
jgi:hypothetical protein